MEKVSTSSPKRFKRRLHRLMPLLKQIKLQPTTKLLCIPHRQGSMVKCWSMGCVSVSPTILVSNNRTFSLATGSVFTFAWTMLISLSFQFVGFLFTYLLHTYVKRTFLKLFTPISSTSIAPMPQDMALGLGLVSPLFNTHFSFVAALLSLKKASSKILKRPMDGSTIFLITQRCLGLVIQP